MKHLLLITLIVIYAGFSLFSQCEAPIITNWHVDGADGYEISFETEEAGNPLLVKFSELYDDNGVSTSSPYEVYFNGVTVGGSQSETYNMSSRLAELGSNSFAYYFKVDIATICDMDTLWAPTFYMSEGSQLNNPDYECDGELFMPFTFLADGAGFSYSVDFEIEAGDELVQIDELSVLVDIGHTYNGDLSIQLTSPEGTEILLLGFPNDLGSSHGLGVLFQDGGGSIGQSSGPSQSYVSGIYDPAESFTAFEGEILSGIWTITITDNLASDNGFLFGVCFNAETSPCETSITGDVFYDFNSNDILDFDEPIVPFSYINVDTENDIITDINGHFGRCYDPTSMNLLINSSIPYYTASPASYSLTLNEGDFLNNINFAMQPTADDVEDLQIDILIPLIPDRPGFPNEYSVIYTNIGTSCVDDVVLTFTIPVGVSVENVTTDLEYVIEDGMVTIFIGTLCPFQEGEVLFEILVNMDVEIGDQLIYEAIISPIESDYNGIDNNESYISVVQGSFDPNDKAVSHSAINSDFIEDDKKLEYLVRFQNTGTFYAERVEIIDEIEEDLMLNTLEIIDSSHPMEVLVEDNIVHFVFEDIFLAAEEDDPEGSNGYVRFKMQPSETFGLSDEIHNGAEIYFDFNDPIITNTAITVFDPNLGVSETELNGFNIYPNPVKNRLIVDFQKLNNVVEINIRTILGQEVLLVEVKGTRLAEIDLSDISEGNYIIELTTKDGEKLSRKFVK